MSSEVSGDLSSDLSGDLGGDLSGESEGAGEGVKMSTNRLSPTTVAICNCALRFLSLHHPLCPFWVKIEAMDSGDYTLKTSGGCTKNFGGSGVGC